MIPKKAKDIPALLVGAPSLAQGTTPQPLSGRLEHASRLPSFGFKMGVDATRKWPSEGFARPWADEIRMDEETKSKVGAIWKDLGL